MAGRQSTLGARAPLNRRCPNRLDPEADFRHSVVERHWAKVRRYVLRRLRSREDADDLTQETCLRFLRMNTATRVHEPLAYLYGIAAHLLADHQNERARARATVINESDLTDSQVAYGDFSSDTEMEDAVDLQQRLFRALSQLPRTHRSVFLAHKGEGFSHRETAARLSLSVHTVEKYITQARARLRMMEQSRSCTTRRSHHEVGVSSC